MQSNLHGYLVDLASRYIVSAEHVKCTLWYPSEPLPRLRFFESEHLRKLHYFVEIVIYHANNNY